MSQASFPQGLEKHGIAKNFESSVEEPQWSRTGNQCVAWLQCGTLPQLVYECFFYILTVVCSKHLAEEICESQWIDRWISKDNGFLEHSMRALVSKSRTVNQPQHHDSEQELGSQSAVAFARAFLKGNRLHLNQEGCESHLQCKALGIVHLPEGKAAEEIQRPLCQTRKDMQLFDIKPG